MTVSGSSAFHSVAGPHSPYLGKILSTHWLRTPPITLYASVLLGWAVDAMAS